MLTKCPECDLQISDKAIVCPHCGFPLKSSAKKLPREKSRKRMKLPNGFGRITKIKGRLRKPYRAMVTIGKDSTGRPIGRLLKPNAYFETYNEAYAALVEYNRDPFDLTNDITVQQLYEKWSKEYFDKIVLGTARSYKLAWRYSEPLRDMNIRDVRMRHVKTLYEEGTIVYRGEKRKPTDTIKLRIRSLWIAMFDYAVENEYLDRNRLKDLKNVSYSSKENFHTIYYFDELQKIWDNADMETAKILLVQCYSGLRPGELLNLKKKNIDVDNNTMIAGSKTKAGKDRIVPIHPLIKNIVIDLMSNDTEYLLRYRSYAGLLKQFTKLKDLIGLENTHKLHDGRKTFVTMAKKYDLNEYAIKHIIGHSVSDLTESTYTERDPKWLYKEICKIRQY